jgi:hypothetical protein
MLSIPFSPEYLENDAVTSIISEERTGEMSEYGIGKAHERHNSFQHHSCIGRIAKNPPDNFSSYRRYIK